MMGNLVYHMMRRPWGIASIFAVFGAIGANYWFNLFPPQGVKIADLANNVYSDTLFIPASYAFSIWGLIYCGLIGFSFYQLRLSERRYGFVLDTRPWLILACILQTSWVYLFIQRSLLASTVVMFGLLLTIIYCYLRLGVGNGLLSRRDRRFLHYPWSIYLAWISVATIVNVAITLKEYGWNGFGLPQPIWTIGMMSVAALNAAAMLKQRRDWLYVAVIIWALLALVLRYASIFAIAGSGLLWVSALTGMLFVWYLRGCFWRSV